MFHFSTIHLAFICNLFVSPVNSFVNTGVPISQVQVLSEKMLFIGEIKGYSYIKVELEPVNISSEFIAEGDDQLKYKGTYFESATGRKYRVTGVFSVEGRSWTFRCFDTNNREVFVFKGKQEQDGRIEGMWLSNAKKHSFYLRPQ